MKQFSEQNLSQVEQAILSTPEEEFDNIYTDDEFLYAIMETTKSKEVFLKCMNHLVIDFLLEKVKDSKISQEMLFKLTLHPNSLIQFALLKREDITAKLLKQMIENFEYEPIKETRWHIINHPKMDEQTLYDLTDCNNNQVLCAILLTNKTSQRIIKKLQNNDDIEVQTIAKVRDPETEANYIEKVIKKEIRNADKTNYDYINSKIYYEKSYIINDILEGALRNPKLPSELVSLFKRFSKTAVLTLVIPHPNVSDDLLDYYYQKGDDDVKKAIFEKRKKEEFIH